MLVNKVMQERIIKISKDTGIPTKKVWDLLYILRSGDPVENNELLQKLGVSKNALNQAKEMLSNLLEEPSRNTKLKENTIEEIQHMFYSVYKTEEALWSILENTTYEQTLNILKKYERKRPQPDRRYDQFSSTIETTARRASLLEWFSDIDGKRLLFLGDDDLTSVAVSNTKRALDITALDIDDRILETIDEISTNENLKIKTEYYDAQKPLPSTHTGKYDVVFTDPPYTTEGIELFASRAVNALDLTNQAARIYLCYGNSDRAKERFLPIYDIIESSGLMVRWVFDKFNRYNGAESIGSASSLFILDATSKTNSLITGSYDKPIYTNN